MASLAIAHRSRGPKPLRQLGPYPMASPSDVVATSGRLHRWRLGFEQSSPRHIARVSRGGTVHVFRYPSLSRHAVVPFGFRLQVSRVTQESPLELLLTRSGIQPRVTRRTTKTPSSSSAERSNGSRSISAVSTPVRPAARSARASTPSL